jgi:translation initiation factor 4G
MTSPANQQNPVQATNTPATTASSYASAAGAPKKSVQAPVVASSSQPPIVVGSAASPAQNAKSASPAPVNGKTTIAPAIPTVVRSTPTISGPEHPPQGSVTMASNGSNSLLANGAAAVVGGAAPKFGFHSPAIDQSTPQTAHAAPVPVPQAGNPRITSPAHSPTPIPQPSESGGPPASAPPGGTPKMMFGAFDGERPAGQNSAAGTHFRRESNHSAQGDNPGTPGRGGFSQGGRGRGFNPHSNSFNNQMGYPPNNQFRNGPGQGRGMPPAFQPQSRNMPYPNSPQPNRSPALVPSLPGTPNMPPATMQSMQTPPHFHYPPPMAPQHQQNFGYPPQQMDQYGRPMSMGYQYNNMGYMGPPQPGQPGYNQQFVPPPYHQQGHSMSRTPSQPDRPSSAHQQNQPVIVSSTPQTQNAQLKSGSSNFVKPRKSAALVIKNAAGEVVDLPSAVKQPASPSPAISQSKTPPVTSTPTPPPKSATTTHARNDSQVATKTAKEIQDELKEKIKQVTKPQEEKPAPAPAPVAAEATPEPVPAVKQDEPKATETKVEEPTPKAEETKPAAESEEEELERMIREMEEAEVAREKKEEEHRKKKAAEAAAKKAEADKNKLTPEEEDRKLREQEREMERLEEEKEKKRQQGSSLSVAEALAQARGDAPAKTEAPSVEKTADKLSELKIEDKPAAPAPKFPSAAEKRGKPAALNLAPINTKSVEPPQPTAALQSLQSARFLEVMGQEIYPEGIKSPNPALNAAVTKKGKTFKYDANFLLQFQKVFTEQPSLEFHQQVKSLIGDDSDRSKSARGRDTPVSARPPSGRPGGSGAFTMGSFNPPVRTLPPGTTSAERFNASGGQQRPGPGGALGSFQNRPGGSFPGGSMSRNPSHSNNPSSPRTNSRRGGGSKRPDYKDVKAEAQAAKTMPLTAGMELKPIVVSESGWKPTSIGSKAGPAAGAPVPSGYLDPEMVQRKVKAALNKMTPEKFDRIADQILLISSQSKDESDGRTLRQVIQLTFEKATDEAHWASMYAKFCKRMLETMSPDVRDERIKDRTGNIVSGGNLFRKYLLNRCQEEFERGWTSNLPEAPKEEEAAEKKTGDAAMLSEEYYKAAAAKRRGLGLVQFIGELYKLGMLTERIMHECVRKLVDYKGVPDEAEIESLSKLLRTIGANLDATEKGRPMMDMYFQRITTMMNLPELPSRMQFMLLDVVDLRKAGWHSKEANKGPKTLEEVRVEAEAAQAAKAQESARNSQRGGGGGRPPAGRGDARAFSAGYQQQTSNQVAMDDLRRLKGSASRTASQNVTLGPGASMFSSRSNSGRRLGPGGSLGRPGEDSGASSRTGTPPVRDNSHSNAFSLLANMETENPTSPPSTSVSPAISKVVPDSDKKESD